MSKLNALAAASLAGAILVTAFAAGSSANAAPQGRSAEQGQVVLAGGDRHNRENDRRGWDGRHGWGDHRPGHWERLGARQIRRSLRHQGFEYIRILDERGPVYIVGAEGWRGMPVRLIVDAFNGRILRQEPMGRHFRGGFRW